MDKKHQRIILTVGVAAYVILMIVGAVIPNPDSVPVFSGHTKYFHFFGFILLSGLVFRMLELYNVKRKELYSFTSLALFIVLTEFLQLFVITRHPLFTDMIIDGIGCLIGYGVYRIIFRK